MKFCQPRFYFYVWLGHLSMPIYPTTLFRFNNMIYNLTWQQLESLITYIYVDLVFIKDCCQGERTKIATVVVLVHPSHREIMSS